MLKTSVKGARFGLPFFLVMKLAAVRPEVEYIIQKGAEKPAMKAAPFACIVCYLGFDSSEAIGGFFCGFNLISLQGKTVGDVLPRLFS